MKGESFMETAISAKGQVTGPPPLLVPSWLYANGFTQLQRDVLCFVAMRGKKCTDNKKTMATYLGVNKSTLKKAVDELVEFGWLLRSWEAKTMVLRVSNKGEKIARSTPTKNKSERFARALHRTPQEALHRTSHGPCTGPGTMYITMKDNYGEEEDLKTEFYNWRRNL